MKKIFAVLIAFLLFSSHDMYLKLDTYFLQPNTAANIKLFNGTFDKSENVIDRNRMIDVSLVGNGKRLFMDTTQWSERDSMTILNFTTGAEGTWLAGVSTKARNIEMTAADFNDYLAHDGVVDMLDWREKNNALEENAIEKYAKHVKTIFQVGEKTTDDWKTVLGYPIEFIPLSNPYDLHKGDALQVKLLLKGQPLANQLVLVDFGNATHSHDHAVEHDHAAEEGHSHTSGMEFRTDAEGQLTMELKEEGIWYLRTISMVLSEEAGLTHESNWATLTFEVGHGHSHADESHSHAHEEQLNIPSYIFYLGSAVLIVGLFFWFNRKS